VKTLKPHEVSHLFDLKFISSPMYLFSKLINFGHHLILNLHLSSIYSSMHQSPNLSKKLSKLSVFVSLDIDNAQLPPSPQQLLLPINTTYTATICIFFIHDDELLTTRGRRGYESAE